MQAAAHPAKVDYLYFVRKPDCRSHFFTASIDEFDAYTRKGADELLSGRRRLVGLIGNPVEHSLSPAMQNAAFAARGLDWAYVPLLVEDGRVEDAVRGLVALGFAGANVTAPHKAAAARRVRDRAGVGEHAPSSGTVGWRGSRRTPRSSTGCMPSGP